MNKEQALEYACAIFKGDHEEMWFAKSLWLAGANTVIEAGQDSTPRWRPISEAPRDGTTILVWFNDGWAENEAISSWWDREHGWTCQYTDSIQPTHFMPLPAPPEEG